MRKKKVWIVTILLFVLIVGAVVTTSLVFTKNAVREQPHDNTLGQEGTVEEVELDKERIFF